jgi:hypothetical protein
MGWYFIRCASPTDKLKRGSTWSEELFRGTWAGAEYKGANDLGRKKKKKKKKKRNMMPITIESMGPGISVFTDSENKLIHISNTVYVSIILDMVVVYVLEYVWGNLM